MSFGGKVVVDEARGEARDLGCWGSGSGTGWQWQQQARGDETVIISKGSARAERSSSIYRGSGQKTRLGRSGSRKLGGVERANIKGAGVSVGGLCSDKKLKQ
jgi:hypothetical protein